MERGSLYESARSHGGGLARSRPARAEGTTREIEDHT
jgi:hypothetical protein